MSRYMSTGDNSENINLDNVSKYGWQLDYDVTQVLQEGDIFDITITGKLNSGDEFEITDPKLVYEFAQHQQGFINSTVRDELLLYYARKSLEYETAAEKNSR